MAYCTWTLHATALGVLLSITSACQGPDDDAGLPDAGGSSALEPPVPAADGPQLASIAPETPVHELASVTSKSIGYLRAGALVARADKPWSTEGCEGGWYPVRPRGFVCLDSTATLDLAHPALGVMKTQPNPSAALPYRYARASRATTLFTWDRARGAAVRKAGALRQGGAIAIVGSWNALDPDGAMRQLAMNPAAQFVDTKHIKETTGSSFRGVELGQIAKLPVAFVVKRGVHLWAIDGNTPQSKATLEQLSSVPITGRYRTLNSMKYWATEDGRWVRHRDVTVVPRRGVYPDFAKEQQKWIDISIVTGTLVAYEGRTPVFATLVSVGADRLDESSTAASTQRGSFTIVAKHLTTSQPPAKPFDDSFEVQDAPWVQVLSSGQALHGAFWHSRFGIEHGPGNVHLSPADASWLFRWTTPEVPPGWHAVTGSGALAHTFVVIRK